MFLDAQTLLWDAAVLTADAASTNAYDSADADNEIGTGEQLALVIQVDSSADHTDGDETYKFSIIQSANTNLSSPDYLADRTISYADLTAGSLHYIVLPPGAKTKRYLGAYIDVSGTTPTVTVTAWFAPASMIEKWKAYDDSMTIS